MNWEAAAAAKRPQGTMLANDSGDGTGQDGKATWQGEDKPSPLPCQRIALPGSSIVGAMACPRPIGVKLRKEKEDTEMLM